MSTLVLIVFVLYFVDNIKPKKTDIKFYNISNNQNFMKKCEIENNQNKISIYLDTTSEIFKQQNYHSYISGDGVGKNINLKMYLISKQDSSCFEIKSYCYENTNLDNLKFLGYYNNKFIKQDQKYNLAIYVPENEILYMTDIEI